MDATSILRALVGLIAFFLLLPWNIFKASVVGFLTALKSLSSSLHLPGFRTPPSPSLHGDAWNLGDDTSDKYLRSDSWLAEQVAKLVQNKQYCGCC